MGGKWISRISRPRDFSRAQGSVVCINILTLLRFSGPADGSSWTLAGPKRLSLPYPACQPAPRLPGTKCRPLQPRQEEPGRQCRTLFCLCVTAAMAGLGPASRQGPSQSSWSGADGLPCSTSGHLKCWLCPGWPAFLPHPDPECPSLLPPAEPQLSEAGVPSLL